MRAAPCARPAGTARPGSCPPHFRGFFTFLIPRKGARARLGTVPLRPAPLTWNSHLPGPTLCSHLSPHGHHLCHYFTPPLHGPGRAGSPIWALRPPHTPRGWASWGSSFVAFYEESRTLPRSPPHLPRAPPSALSPQGPGTTVAGPTQDRAPGPLPFPLSGEGRRGLSLTTPVAVPTSL